MKLRNMHTAPIDGVLPGSVGEFKESTVKCLVEAGLLTTPTKAKAAKPVKKEAPTQPKEPTPPVEEEEELSDADLETILELIAEEKNVKKLQEIYKEYQDKDVRSAISKRFGELRNKSAAD